MTKDEKLSNYPVGERWRAVDTLGVPHPYCIGADHVAWASDHWGGMLGADAIRDAEKHGVKCDICKNLKRRGKAEVLTYDEHKQALLIEVDFPGSLQDAWGAGLQAYCLSIKNQVEKDGFAGLAFSQKKH